MITYESATGSVATRATGHGSLPGSVSGSTINDRRYAVFAKIEAGKISFTS